MLVRKSKKQRQYLLLLKKEITNFTVNFKKRFLLFPWKEVNKISKIIDRNETISVNDIDYTVKELINIIGKTKVKLQSKLKPNYYNYILHAYIKDSMNKTDDELKQIYDQYNNELQKIFNESKDELLFCLNGLREMNKLAKKSNKNINESYTSVNDNLTFESDNKSNLDPSFKKKTGKSFKYLDLSDNDVYFYMHRDHNVSKEGMKKIRKLFKGCIAVNIEDDRYAGYVFVTKKDNVISPLWIFEPYRGYGIGEELLKKSIYKYGADGLWVYDDNKIAINLYKKYGFYKTKHTEKRKDGTVIFMNLDKRYIKESNEVFDEGTHSTNFFRHLYHVSPDNLDGKVLHPRVPSNKLTLNNLEDGTTARVCFAPSIDKCLMALSQNLKDKEFYVHIPAKKVKYMDTNRKLVPDSTVTKEKWVTLDVELKCIGKIKVHEAQDKPYKFSYSDKNVAPSWTYKWNWEWIDKYTKESSQDDLDQKCFNDFVQYVKGAQQDGDPCFANIKPLNNYMINDKIKDCKRILFATYNGGLNKKTSSQFIPNLNKNILYNNKNINFGTCYLPGDIFIYADIPNDEGEIKMEQYIENYVSNVYSDDVYEETFKDTLKQGEVKFKDALNKYATPVNNKINSGTDYISKKLVRKPKEGAPSHVYDDYQKKISRVKATAKAVFIGAMNVPVFIMPIPGSSTLFNAIVLETLNNSNDSGDKVLHGLLESLLIKVKDLKSRIATFYANNKKGFKTKEEAEKQFKALDANAKLVAKEIDNYKNRQKAVACESTSIDFSELLTESTGELSIEFYEKVNSCIDNADFTNKRDIEMCEMLTDLIIKDSNLNIINESEDISMINESKEYSDLFAYKIVNNDGNIIDTRDIIIESYEWLLNYDDDADEFTEGVNLDIRSKFKDTTKRYAKCIKECNKNIKRNRFAEARKNIADAKVIINDSIKEIKNIEYDSTASTILGIIAESVIYIIKAFLVSIATLGLGTIFVAIHELLDIINGIRTSIRKSGKNLTINDFNLYRDKIIGTLVKFSSNLDMMNKRINDKEREYKASQKSKNKELRQTNESAEFKAERLSIYEACSSGAITLGEREYLLKNLRDKYYLSEASSDIIDSPDENTLSNKEKFEAVRSALYERCSNGEITLEERENLILKAKDRFMSESDQTPDINTKDIEKNVKDAQAEAGKDLDKALDIK